MEEAGTLTTLRRLLAVQQDQIRHISELSRKLIEAHFLIRDHFYSLHQRHEALVVLLEDLGVIGESKLKAFAHRAHDGSSATPLLRVLSDPDCASAILVGAGSASLSALCCASRGCIETLATLLVQVPPNSPAASKGSTDMHEQLQAQLWQSVWKPTLAIWEAQAQHPVSPVLDVPPTVAMAQPPLVQTSMNVASSCPDKPPMLKPAPVEELQPPPCSSQAAPAQGGLSPEQACSRWPQARHRAPTPEPGGQIPSGSIARIVECKGEKAHWPASKRRSEETLRSCGVVVTRHVRKHEMLPESDVRALSLVSRDAHLELVKSPLEVVREEARTRLAMSATRRPRERMQPMPLQPTKGRSSTMASRSCHHPTSPEALAATEVVALSAAPKGRRPEEMATAKPRQRGSAFEEMLRVRSREGMDLAEASAQAEWNAEEEVRRQLRDAALGRRARHHEPHRGTNPIRTGELVIVRGLTVRPDLNDVSGTVLSWSSNRWLVQLSTGERVRLGRENLAVKGSPKDSSKVDL